MKWYVHQPDKTLKRPTRQSVLSEMLVSFGVAV